VIAWEAAGATDVGRVRQGNEDAFHMDPARGLFLVADGMGGHAAGEVASALAVETVTGIVAAALDERAGAERLDGALREAFARAHEAITRRAADEPKTRGMGTTLTLAVLDPAAATFRIGHVGDSRAYVFRDGRAAQVTRDHTWVQAEVDAGRLAPSGARSHPFAHVITRALGAGIPQDEPDLLAGPLAPGDVLLLATDGLTGMIGTRTINAVLREDAPLADQVTALIDAANRRGGADNITAVLVRILPG
jgi:protein phosphatase